MASRDSQGLQIALILFVMLAAVLAVTTFIFARSASERQAALDSVQARYNNESAAHSKVQTEFNTLKEMIGQTADATIDQIQPVFDEDMAMFEGAVDDAQRNYKGLVDHLLTVNGERNRQLADASDRVQQLTAAKGQVEKDAQSRIAAVTAEQKKLADEFAQEQAKFVEDGQRREAAKTNLRKQLVDAQANISQVVGQKDADIQRLTADLAKRSDINTELQERLNQFSRPSLDIPDGIVVGVNQRSRIVWINIGRAESLRKQTVFSVFDEGQHEVASAEKKGSIEVVYVRGEHLAEAHIVDNELANPIKSGDLIHSPVWDPGRRVRFALVGSIDIDGDGKSDRELVRNLIHRNGGIIDAEVDEDGKRSGRLSVSTRYLIGDNAYLDVGERVTNQPSKAEFKAYADFVDEATKLNIERMPVEELIDFVGWRLRMRTTKMDYGSRRRSRSDASSEEPQPTSDDDDESTDETGGGTVDNAAEATADEDAGDNAEDPFSDDPFGEDQ